MSTDLKIQKVIYYILYSPCSFTGNSGPISDSCNIMFIDKRIVLERTDSLNEYKHLLTILCIISWSIKRPKVNVTVVLI